MTVSELIEYLGRFNGEVEVWITTPKGIRFARRIKEGEGEIREDIRMSKNFDDDILMIGRWDGC